MWSGIVGILQRGLLAFSQEWPCDTMGWAGTSRSDAVVRWKLHSLEKETMHLFPTPTSMTSC